MSPTPALSPSENNSAGVRTLTRRIPSTHRGILTAIGNTPVVQFQRYLDDPSLTIHGKLEAFNPGGSAKDRPACLIIEDALAAGRIPPSTLIVGKHGNRSLASLRILRTGISLRCRCERSSGEYCG